MSRIPFFSSPTVAHKKRAGRPTSRPPKPRIEVLVLLPHQRPAGNRILEPAELGGNDVDELSQFAAPKHISGGRQLVLCRAEKPGRSRESLDLSLSRHRSSSVGAYRRPVSARLNCRTYATARLRVNA